jgi:hypothetical protein
MNQRLTCGTCVVCGEVTTNQDPHGNAVCDNTRCLRDLQKIHEIKQHARLEVEEGIR